MDLWLLGYFIISAIYFHKIVLELPPISLLPNNRKVFILLIVTTASLCWLGMVIGGIVLVLLGKQKIDLDY